MSPPYKGPPEHAPLTLTSMCPDVEVWCVTNSTASRQISSEEYYPTIDWCDSSVIRNTCYTPSNCCCYSSVSRMGNVIRPDWRTCTLNTIVALPGTRSLENNCLPWRMTAQLAVLSRRPTGAPSPQALSSPHYTPHPNLHPCAVPAIGACLSPAQSTLYLYLHRDHSTPEWGIPRTRPTQHTLMD